MKEDQSYHSWFICKFWYFRNSGCRNAKFCVWYANCVYCTYIFFGAFVRLDERQISALHTEQYRYLLPQAWWYMNPHLAAPYVIYDPSIVKYLKNWVNHRQHTTQPLLYWYIIIIYSNEANHKIQLIAFIQYS